MRLSLPVLTLGLLVPFALPFAVGMLAVMSASAGCETSGYVPPGEAGPTMFLPDGAPYVPSDGGPSIACVFEELDTFSCPGVTLAPPVWVTSCVNGDDCSTRVDGPPTTAAGCQETISYQNAQEVSMSCAAWTQSGASLPAVDSGPQPVCAPGSVASFKPTWHPPKAKASVCSPTQIDSYLQCLNDAATTLDPPSCAEWSGTLSSSDATCLSCLSSNEPDAEYGPLVSLPTALVINVAGCIALAEGKTDGSGCGGAIQADQQCQEAACLPTCPVGSTSLDDAENACEVQANTLPADGGTGGGVCGSYATAAQCAPAIASGDAGTTAEQQCFGAPGGGTNALFEAVSLAFCGGQ